MLTFDHVLLKKSQDVILNNQSLNSLLQEIFRVVSASFLLLEHEAATLPSSNFYIAHSFSVVSLFISSDKFNNLTLDVESNQLLMCTI